MLLRSHSERCEGASIPEGREAVAPSPRPKDVPEDEAGITNLVVLPVIQGIKNYLERHAD